MRPIKFGVICEMMQKEFCKLKLCLVEYFNEKNVYFIIFCVYESSNCVNAYILSSDTTSVIGFSGMFLGLHQLDCCSWICQWWANYARFMMFYDDLWCFLMFFDDLWCFVMIYDDFWWFMMFFVDSWWFMMICDDL